MKTIYQILIGAAISAAFGFGYWLGDTRQPTTTHTHTETVHWRGGDTLPVPYAVPGRDCTIVVRIHQHDTTLISRWQQVRDTVYADCDSAHRYTLVHSDTNVKITYTADICGRLLSHNLRYDAYRHTVVLTPDEQPRKDYGLYTTATTGGAVGLYGAHGRWLFGYQYSAFGAQQWQRHALTVGFRLFPIKP